MSRGTGSKLSSVVFFVSHLSNQDCAFTCVVPFYFLRVGLCLCLCWGWRSGNPWALGKGFLVKSSLRSSSLDSIEGCTHEQPPPTPLSTPPPTLWSPIELVLWDSDYHRLYNGFRFYGFDVLINAVSHEIRRFLNEDACHIRINGVNKREITENANNAVLSPVEAPQVDPWAPKMLTKWGRGCTSWMLISNQRDVSVVTQCLWPLKRCCQFPCIAKWNDLFDWILWLLACVFLFVIMLFQFMLMYLVSCTPIVNFYSTTL